ncbi:NAD(P)H-binding protein [Streptomyces indonesiensis]
MPEPPILVTGAAGSIGAVGRTVVEELRRRELPVRAMVRREDERAEALRATGAEVVAGDLTRAPDVVRVLDGCGRMYFGMSVSPTYLEATMTTAAVARDYARLDALVNMSQMTVSQMDLTSTSESTQQREHWLAEQALNWSGLPVTHLRPTVFLENPLFSVFVYRSIAEEGTIRLPFGAGRTSPVAARDVAAVVAAILVDPSSHIGRTYHLTGPASVDMTTLAEEFADALGLAGRLCGRLLRGLGQPRPEGAGPARPPLRPPRHDGAAARGEPLRPLDRRHRDDHGKARDRGAGVRPRAPRDVHDMTWAERKRGASTAGHHRRRHRAGNLLLGAAHPGHPPADPGRVHRVRPALGQPSRSASWPTGCAASRRRTGCWPRWRRCPS